MWRPNSLHESISEAVNFPRDKNGRYQCPNCKVFRVAACIIDVRQLPITEGWACDCCWTQWQRELRNIDGNETVKNQREWALRWVTAHKAPTEIIAKFML